MIFQQKKTYEYKTKTIYITVEQSREYFLHHAIFYERESDYFSKASGNFTSCCSLYVTQKVSFPQLEHFYEENKSS